MFGGKYVNITNEKKINKNIEECQILCNRYIDILEFLINYLKITQEKANENILKFIENYTGQIKYIKNIFYQFNKIKKKMII